MKFVFSWRYWYAKAAHQHFPIIWSYEPRACYRAHTQFMVWHTRAYTQFFVCNTRLRKWYYTITYYLIDWYKAYTVQIVYHKKCVNKRDGNLSVCIKDLAIDFPPPLKGTI